MKIILLLILTIKPFTLLAFECELKGKKSKPGTVYITGGTIKKSFNVHSFYQCIVHARDLLKYKRLQDGVKCQNTYPCLGEKFQVLEKIKKVKYKYISDKEEVSGTLKPR